MTSESYRREAIARLCTYCETLISRSVLPEDQSLMLGVYVDVVCSAFDMAPVQNSNAENVA